MPTDYVKIRLAELKAGVQLKCPIYDARSDRNQLLLAAGAFLSQSQLELLKRRGVSQVLVHRGDLERVTTGADRRTAVKFSPLINQRSTTWTAPTQPVAAQTPASWKQNGDSFLREIAQPRSLTCNIGMLRSFQRTFDKSLQSTENMFAEFAREQKINSAMATRVADQQLEQVAEDLDLHVAIGIRPVTEGYPTRHSLQMSMLAVSIGTIMGLSREDLVELSTGCLLHDAGMMLVPRHIIESNGPLSTADRLEVLKHPLYIANALSGRNDISHNAKATAYQIHERMNGSGYPRKRSHPQIHQFARIGAVADTYLAMISPRNGRGGLSPYAAVEKLLYATRIGLFDPAVVRALLHAVSLFPVGSIVSLSDGRSARVTRSNRDRYDRPIVEVLSRESQGGSELINLAEEPLLHVIGTGELIAV